MAQQNMPLRDVIRKVQSMTTDPAARKIVQSKNYSIHKVTWEDCARNKNSVWGPCISDMTLQVGESRMPVIRENNYSDTTWDIEMDKIPLVVGNELRPDTADDTDSDHDDAKHAHAAENNTKLQTISLTQYLRDFDRYLSDKASERLFDANNKKSADAAGQTINLLRKDETKDSHVIVSSQACFLPIENGKETLFNVALFNHQSRKQDPAVLVIVATSKGTSAQIVEGSQQKLIFNERGKKADFIGQRLTDNRIERGVKDLSAPMTVQERQDNCIMIIQVPLKQSHVYPSTLNNYYNVLSNQVPNLQNLQNVQNLPFAPSPPVTMTMAQPISMDNHNHNNLTRAQVHMEVHPIPQHFQQHLGAPMSAMHAHMGALHSLQSMQSMQAIGSNATQVAHATVTNGSLACAMIPADARGNRVNNYKNNNNMNSANVESAIVKIAPKLKPVCVCGRELEKTQLQFAYGNFSKPARDMTRIDCDRCGKVVGNVPDPEEKKNVLVWHCKREKREFKHRTGYDLCLKCGNEEMMFDELNGMKKIIERDERYPVRVTLQYYKSTDNGVIDANIMQNVAELLKESRKKSDYVGSLVLQQQSDRKTEWTGNDIGARGGNGYNHGLGGRYFYNAGSRYVAGLDAVGGIRSNRRFSGKRSDYKEIRNVLGDLGLSGYFAKFVKHEVCDARLGLLKDSDLQAVFEKIGPRCVFREWLELRKNGGEGRKEPKRPKSNKMNENGGKDCKDVDVEMNGVNGANGVTGSNGEMGV